jgi:uncharacterized 2Fe-2S/4Fe-4S cluster protein (DUF4445 family)
MHSDESKSILVDFEPVGKRVQIGAGQTILEAAQKGGIAILSVCGGAGICQDCRVKVMQGSVSDPTPDEEAVFTSEEINSGFRLSCQTRVLGDCKIDIPAESLSGKQRLQLESLERTPVIHPMVRPVDIVLPQTSTDDGGSNEEILLDTLSAAGHSGLTCSMSILDSLSHILLKNDRRVRVVVRQQQIIGLLPYGTAIHGLAVDIGTSKIAIFFVNLETGELVYQAGLMNPQIAYGEDVIARISYSNHSPQHAGELRSRLIDALNEEIKDGCLTASIEPAQIVDAVVVGNTAMHHIFAGLPVRQLGEAPYLPAVTQSMIIHARAAGLAIASEAMIYLPPIIAGFVGADHIAMLIDTQIQSATDTVIALDIGTNTEISLKTHGYLFSCSCASGPAFEGARIEMGMRAAPGAIEKVELIRGELKYSTIDHLPPIGICGSGILDAVAVMRMDGAIDRRGSVEKGHTRIVENNHQKKYLLVPKADTGIENDIVVSRKDVNEIQLAKAAIRAGIEALLDQAGITSADVDRFIVAGAFGTYINLKSAIQIGMFPDLPLRRFSQVGNAAGAGARQMLLSINARETAEELARTSNYVELTTYGKFLDLFTKAMIL